MVHLIPPGGIVIYDSDCGICTHAIRFLKWFDWGQKLEFHANNNPETLQKFPDLSIERSRQEILVMDPRTGLYGGFKACEWIACRIPALWILVPFTLIPGVETLGDKTYKLVAKNRHRISKFFGMQACKIQ
jgi:predicted DCC family thiol-disulfide oxidoreductase YuxK